ncbi:Ankyrin repeat [Dillenia turbinata]|uniref:Ankyrin repeat n=1 Tax=Dillenia turbinata TaxID=194707 RepID=A0AAN8USV9_9MAGN
MYGETPLHMAAKNGCSEAARLLLARGAFIKAKAKNGITPLHLSICAKDNEVMTPLNHLSLGPGNEKLQNLLNKHLEQQRTQKALKACSETQSKMDELERSPLVVIDGGVDRMFWLVTISTFMSPYFLIFDGVGWTILLGPGSPYEIVFNLVGSAGPNLIVMEWKAWMGLLRQWHSLLSQPILSRVNCGIVLSFIFSQGIRVNG